MAQTTRLASFGPVTTLAVRVLLLLLVVVMAEALSGLGARMRLEPRLCVKNN